MRFTAIKNIHLNQCIFKIYVLLVWEFFIYMRSIRAMSYYLRAQPAAFAASALTFANFADASIATITIADRFTIIFTMSKIKLLMFLL
tara:strand:- start:239 stop:502 length:264 start_codon:yes stop_codon:yes gene_type:complete